MNRVLPKFLCFSLLSYKYINNSDLALYICYQVVTALKTDRHRDDKGQWRWLPPNFNNTYCSGGISGQKGSRGNEMKAKVNLRSWAPSFEVPTSQSKAPNSFQALRWCWNSAFTIKGTISSFSCNFTINSSPDWHKFSEFWPRRMTETTAYTWRSIRASFELKENPRGLS